MKCMLCILWGAVACLGLLLCPDTKVALCVFSLKAYLEQLVMRHIFTCVRLSGLFAHSSPFFLVLLLCNLAVQTFPWGWKFESGFQLFANFKFAQKHTQGARKAVLVVNTLTAQSLTIWRFLWEQVQGLPPRCCATLKSVSCLRCVKKMCETGN